MRAHLEQERADTPAEKRTVFGACSWIPDAKSSFGDVEGAYFRDKHHPWFVTEPSGIEVFPKLYASPSTSQTQSLSPAVFPMDADVLPTLDKPGYLLLRIRRNYPCGPFCEYEHVGILPEEQCARLRAALIAFQAVEAARINRMCEE